MKKQAKKEKVERQTWEQKRIGDILRYQNLLDAMGAEKVRNDFQTGKHGAVVSIGPCSSQMLASKS